MSDRPLWTVEAMAQAMRATPRGRAAAIDSRHLDRHPHHRAPARRSSRSRATTATATTSSPAALAGRRRPRGGGRRQARCASPRDAPLLVVPDVLDGLRDLARAARARSPAKIIGVTGSVGKTGTKEALRLALGADGETHASVASYNNHWGVPLSLARCPQSARYAVFEIGMNHAGEIEPLTRLVRPHVAIVTTIEPVHLEFFGSLDAIADAKAEIFLGLEPGGAAVINRDNPQFARLAAQREGRRRRARRVVRRARRGRRATGQVCVAGGLLDRAGAHPGRRRHLQARRAGPPCRAQLARGAGRGGARRRRSGARGARARATCSRATGRGARVTLELPGGAALLIDESYNANPASMRAALALLGQAEVGPARPAHRGARRHAGARAARRRSASRARRAGASRTPSISSSAAGR